MTDSSGFGFDDIPPSALTASHLVTDHDVAARIARGHNLLRRPIHDRAAVSRLVIELAEWSTHNRELLSKRFADRRVAEMYGQVAEPFVVPTNAAQVDAQVDLVHRQLRHQVEWLERLRLTIPEREQPDSSLEEPRAGRASQRSVAVLATTASSVAATVVGAVARATGVLPIVVEDQPGERRSLVRAAERTLPADAIAVVVLEPPDEGGVRASSSSLIALGYAAGALGSDDVIAICAPDMARGPELGDFATVTMDRSDGWRHQLEGLLSQLGFRAAAVVSPLRRS
ncbi:MAG TPA: hypothetical protein VGJ03_04985 [Acidimicrobiales bacterium]|jgi:hypothetical protein